LLVSFLAHHIYSTTNEKSDTREYRDTLFSWLSTSEKPQRERLFKTPPPHLSNIMPSLDFELQLVGKITEGIAYVAKQSTPSTVAAVEGARKAMGVSLDRLPYPIRT
jgi:hypothetical protein